MGASLEERDETGARDGWSSYSTSLCTQDGAYHCVGPVPVDRECANILRLTLSVRLVVVCDPVGCHSVELISDRRDICFKGV